MEGIEPSTSWIWIKCSTTELHHNLWFWKDSNPHSKNRSFMCCPLHHKTNCCPDRSRTYTLLNQNQTCCQLHHRTIYVGAIGLEPMNSNEGGVTIRSNCRYATLPNKENRRWSSGHLFLRLALLRWIPPNSDCTSRYSLSNYQYNHSLINLCTPEWIRTTDTWFWRPVL